MWYLSNVSIILSLLVTWTISITSSIGPNACSFSKRCCANFDFYSPYLKFLKCSWNMIFKGFRSVLCTSFYIIQLQAV